MTRLRPDLVPYKFLIYAIHSDNDSNTCLAFFENSENLRLIILKSHFQFSHSSKDFLFNLLLQHKEIFCVGSTPRMFFVLSCFFDLWGGGFCCCCFCARSFFHNSIIFGDTANFFVFLTFFILLYKASWSLLLYTPHYLFFCLLCAYGCQY